MATSGRQFTLAVRLDMSSLVGRTAHLRAAGGRRKAYEEQSRTKSGKNPIFTHVCKILNGNGVKIKKREGIYIRTEYQNAQNP